MNPSIKENASLIAFLIRFIDSTIIVASGLLCFYFLEPVKDFPHYNGFVPQNYLTVIILGFIFSAWWFPAFKVYQGWRGNNLLSEIRALLFAWGCSLVGVLAFIFFTKTATEFSRHWLLLWFVSAYLLLVLLRYAVHGMLNKMHSNGYNLRHIVLVGGGDLSTLIAKKIHKATWMGIKIHGVFSDKSESNKTDLPYLGTLDDVLSYVEERGIDQVWITLPLKKMEIIEALCKQLHSVVSEVKLVPDISSLRLLNYSTSYLDGTPIINMSVSPMSSTNRLIKWMEDKTLSLLILIVVSPLLCLIALSVKLTSPGPIFYKQERIGSNGKKFQMLKFRSMPINNEAEIKWGNAQSKQKTKIGSFLRRTSLDELPQFINTLKGDMSIVGPRPERTVFVDQFKYEIDHYMQKHLVHAGITGWAQVNGWRGDTCLKTRIDHDLFYVENWSLWFDLKIIWMTLVGGINKGDSI